MSSLSDLSSNGHRPRPAEAEAMWRAWRERGDVSSRDRLVLAYAPMVRYLASRKVRELPAHFELEDLVSCGLLALVQAVDRFDPVKGATFEQYAWTRVSGAIVDELRRHDWASRSSRRLRRHAASDAGEPVAANRAPLCRPAIAPVSVIRGIAEARCGLAAAAHQFSRLTE